MSVKTTPQRGEKPYRRTYTVDIRCSDHTPFSTTILGDFVAKQSVKYVQIPKLINGRGTIPITRSYKGVGKIRVSSGTTDEKMYLRIVQTMDDLYNNGNLTTLNTIRDGVMTPLEAYHSVQKNGVHKVVTVDGATLLVESVTKWLDEHPVKESTRRGYKSHLKGFLATCKAADTLKDLPTRLNKYRTLCAKRGIAVSFNQCRTALMAYTATSFRKKAEVYINVKDIDVLPVVKKVNNNAVTVPEMVEFVSHMKPKYAEIVWNLCYSGMRIGEYLEEDGTSWATKSDRLEVTKSDPGHGNKGYSRTVMLPYPLQKSPRQIKGIRLQFALARDKTGMTLTPHSTRKCFAFWMNESGISLIRQNAYMGHEGKTMNDLYTKHEVDTFLTGDAKLFRDYVEEQRNPQPVAPPKKTMKMWQMGPMGMEEVEVEIP